MQRGQGELPELEGQGERLVQRGQEEPQELLEWMVLEKRNMIYLKSPKLPNTKNIAVITLKLEQNWANTSKMPPNHGDIMDKSADPDQTALLSRSIQFLRAYLSENLENNSTFKIPNIVTSETSSPKGNDGSPENHYKSMDAQGQLTPQSVIQSG